MFKLVLFIAVIVVVCGQKVEDGLNLNRDELAQIAAIETKCVKESNAKIEDVHNFDKGQFADNKEIRRFYQCLLTSFGVMNADGVIVQSKINLLVPANLRTKTEHCFKREKGEPYDVAYETYKCYIQTAHLNN